MAENHDDLRKLLSEAWPGPWVTSRKHQHDVRYTWPSGTVTPVAKVWQPQNRDFIAAANPARILAILDELDALRKDAERYAHFIASSPNEEICFMGDTHFGKPALDAAIDAAIEKGGAA